jgi:regulator of RNase E activity RraA
VPVTVGGMVVQPGDIIVGDQDGVLAIAPADVAAVIEGARRQADKEAAALRSIAEGRFDRDWISPQETKMMGG